MDDVHNAVSRALDMIRLSPQQAPASVGTTVGAVLERIAEDTVSTLRLFTQKSAIALPTFLSAGTTKEDILSDLIDPFDLNDLDDAFFSDIAEFYGITEQEARDLFEDFLILGLLSSTWWQLWVQRQRVAVIQRVASRLHDYGMVSELPEDFFGNGGMSDGQKAVVRQAVYDSLLGNDSRSALAVASSMLTTQGTALTNAIIQETVQKNPNTFGGFYWSTILDTRTCLRCGALDGRRVVPSTDQTPPLHPNCRCTLIPLFSGEEIPEGITFSQWLKGKSEKTQDSILGKRFGEMFRDGSFRLSDYVSMRGRVAVRQREL